MGYTQTQKGETILPIKEVRVNEISLYLRDIAIEVNPNYTLHITASCVWRYAPC